MHNMQLAIEALLQLRHLGTAIAFNDFGTGYCSLTHLQQLPMQNELHKCRTDNG